MDRALKQTSCEKEENLLTEQAITYITDLFRDNAGGHDAAHTLRVYRNALMISAVVSCYVPCRAFYMERTG